jgi:hypothetical protein
MELAGSCYIQNQSQILKNILNIFLGSLRRQVESFEKLVSKLKFINKNWFKLAEKLSTYTIYISSLESV